MAKGKFFVIDGTDGSGKATQTELLIQRMRAEGFPVETISFPRYETPTGKIVKKYLDGGFGTLEQVGPKEASRLYADDRHAAGAELRAWLDGGANVVANRYVASNMGHQGAKIATADERKSFFEWNDRLEYGEFGIPRPDLNVILHVPAEIGQKLVDKRGTTHDIHEQSLDHLKAAERTYLEIAKMFPGFILIECVENGQILSREAIHEKVWQIIKPLLTK
jgi:dTMP kinase